MTSVSAYTVDSDGHVTFKNPGKPTGPLLTATFRGGKFVPGSDMVYLPTTTSYSMPPGFVTGDIAVMHRITITETGVIVQNTFSATVPAPAPIFSVTSPQTVKPSSGAWATQPALADAFNPTKSLSALWYGGTTLASATSADNGGNGASYSRSSQAFIKPDGLHLETVRTSIPITVNGVAKNYLSGAVSTFADGQTGTPRFVFNPSSAKAWAFKWSMTMPINTDPTGIAGGLDMGVWFFDADLITYLGVWKHLEVDLIEIFGWGSDLPLAYGPLAFVDPPDLPLDPGPWKQSPQTPYETTSVSYEAMLDNVEQTASLAINGEIIFTQPYPSWVPTTTMCGVVLSNDLRSSGAAPSWLGSRDAIVHDFSVWPDSTAVKGTDWKGGGIASGTLVR